MFLQARYVLIVILVCVSSLTASVAAWNHVPYASQVDQAETVTTVTSLSTSLSQSQLLISSAFKVISTTGTTLPCMFWNFSFTGSQGQYVYANFTSDIPLNFYIVQNTTFQSWLKHGSCGNAADALANQANSMSYGLSSTLPNSGTWTIVLVNMSNSRDADGFITASLGSASYTITQPVVETVVLAGTSTSSTTLSVTPSSTTSSPGIPGFPVESIAIGIVIGLGVLMILRYRRRLERPFG